MWPELLKAKDAAESISNDIDALLKNHRALTKREIATQKDTLIAHTDDTIARIDEKIADLKGALNAHRKYVESKSLFVRRHYSREKRI